jgi:peptidoglycan hydrolase-like protein with peptidoglycan-binding domain
MVIMTLRRGFWLLVNKIQNKVIILIFIFCTSFIFVNGQCGEKPTDCFKEKPTLENFQNLQNPTYKQFNQLSELDKKGFLTQKLKGPLSTSDMAIFDKYIEENVWKQNFDKKIFEDYFYKRTGSNIELNGNLKSFKPPSLHTYKDSLTNYHDLPKGSTIIINPDGHISFKKKDSDKITEFQGEIIYDKNKDSFGILNGKVNGKTARGAILKINDNGIITGKARVFDELYFTDQEAINYDPENNLLTLNGAEIEYSHYATNLYLRGNMKLAKDSRIDGRLKVKTGDKLVVNGITIDNSYIKKNPFNKDINKGERSEKVRTIQRMLIDEDIMPKLSDSGKPNDDAIFGDITEKYIKEWQNKYNLNPTGKFDTASINQYNSLYNTNLADVDLRVGNPAMFGKEKGNYVRFFQNQDVIKVNGDDFKVEFSESTFKDNLKNIKNSKLTFNDPPKIGNRNYYKLGDKFEKDSQTYTQMKDLKTTLNSWYKNNYGKSFLSNQEIDSDTYSASTKELVKLFQIEHNKQNYDDTISTDGLWGKDSIAAYEDIFENKKKTIIIEPNGGHAKVSFDDNKIKIDANENVDLVVGNKKFLVSNDKIYQSMSQSIANQLHTDVELNVLNEGDKVIETFSAKGQDLSLNNINLKSKIDKVVAERMDTEKVHCAEFIRRAYIYSKFGTGLSEDQVKKISEELGIIGSSWRMGHNIKGEQIYKREYDLSLEEQEVLFEVEKATRSLFYDLNDQGLSNEEIRKKLRDTDISNSFPSHLQEKYQGMSLSQIHDQVFTQKDVSFDIKTLEDKESFYIGLYHKNSDYLGSASLNGKTIKNEKKQATDSYDVDDSLKNTRYTHSALGYWGESEQFSGSSSKSIKQILKQKYNLKNDASLNMLGQISVNDPNQNGLLRRAEFGTDGKLYFSSDLNSNGDPKVGVKNIDKGTTIEVKPIFVKELDGSIHTRTLAKSVDEKNSVYQVNAFDQKKIASISEEIGQNNEWITASVQSNDLIDTLRQNGIPESEIYGVAEQVRKINNLNSDTIGEHDIIKIPPAKMTSANKQASINLRLRENNVKNPEEWSNALIASSPKRLSEYGLSSIHEEDLTKLTAGVIKRESNFGDSKRYMLKGLLAYIPNVIDARGYGQIHIPTAELLAKENGDAFHEDELNSISGSVKYTQRLLAQSMKIYASDNEVMDKETKEIIAVTYNSGLLTPRNAALQNQLKDLGHINPEIRSTGNVGDNTVNGLKQFAESKNIEIESDEIKKMLMLSNKEDFESSEIYLKLKSTWSKQNNAPAKYAQLPEYKTQTSSGLITSNGYAKEVVQFADSTCYSSEEYIC